MLVLPEMVGSMIGVHQGKGWIQVEVKVRLVFEGYATCVILFIDMHARVYACVCVFMRMYLCMHACMEEASV